MNPAILFLLGTFANGIGLAKATNYTPWFAAAYVLMALSAAIYGERYFKGRQP